MNYNWNWAVLFQEPYLGWLLSGLQWTLLVAIAAWVIARSEEHTSELQSR